MRSEGTQKLTVHGHLDQVQHDKVRQLDGIDELTVGFQAPGVDQLHQQAQQIGLVNPRCRDTRGLGRNAVDKSIQHPLVDGSDGHQIFA